MRIWETRLSSYVVLEHVTFAQQCLGAKQALRDDFAVKSASGVSAEALFERAA